MDNTAPKSSVSPIIIKKYANRRLYNTATSAYMTQENLAEMVRADVDFVVRDAKTNDDITHQVLKQIILEQDNNGGNLLPISFLRQLISFSGDSLQVLVPRYLDATMGTFSRNQDKLRQYVKDSVTQSFFSFNPWEEVNRQNQSLWNNFWSFSNPFVGRTQKSESVVDSQLDSLQKQIQALEKQVTALAKK
jgi:polyhydroxyalkanoate synthesis repressor PhaR